MLVLFDRKINSTLHRVTMTCDPDELARAMYMMSTNATVHIGITLSAIVVFIATSHVCRQIRKDLAQLTVIVIGAGPIGLTAALLALRCKRVTKLIIYEEESRARLEKRSYQIAIQPQHVSFLRGCGVDFDNLEGLWEDGCFYTRVGIYLGYIINILQLYKKPVDFNFSTKFSRDLSACVDSISGRKLAICCDGRNGLASRVLGLSDESIHHSTGVYGALAAIEKNNETYVPKSEIRVHNVGFDLSAYNSAAYEDEGKSKFNLKIFGNSTCRFLALAINKTDSNVVKTLRTVLDKSMMRNIFLKCFNTYKRADEASISDSFCLHHMRFSPRLYEIKLSQRAEIAAYIADCDLFVITEGEASRSYNFNTGLDINAGFKGLVSLRSFVDQITLADTEYNITKTLVWKMDHSEKICKDLIKHGLKEYM
ncbi:uncharacterized protein LOC127845629 isoform X2 [Dreissena polymorpha]|uniref:uncharacterized protein LOC127845629 isoform X2 n=1 Tax=Dreissena polymorpha TaxID=45954 RepID=UPI002263F6A1|nr:uncharacterized protein LOC127845629 isoform X2 [Dreissena polymorpha]